MVDLQLRQGMGIRIRNKRNEKRMTIDNLSEKIDMNANNLGRVERGQSGIGLEKLVALSNVLEVSLDWLVKGDEIADYYRLGQLAAISKNMTDEGFGKMLKTMKTLKENSLF
jgi:transcriptional regulator with XRE-family HTH domain